MSRTDKDAPFPVRKARGEVGHSGNWGSEDSGFRKGRRALKKQGHRWDRRSWKQPRYSKVPFMNSQTVRFAVWDY